MGLEVELPSYVGDICAAIVDPSGKRSMAAAVTREQSGQNSQWGCKRLGPASRER